MGKFAKPEKQAASVVKYLQRDGHIYSLGTARNYTNALTRVAEYSQNMRIKGGLRGMEVNQVETYLTQRATEVGQKQLDMERQALQMMLQKLTGKLENNARLKVIRSQTEQQLKCRSYTSAQVNYISEHQKQQNSLSTQIAHKAGLRAHELLTIQTLTNQHPSPRPSLESKFKGREGDLYTVQGKGGLIRTVCLPKHIVQQLESLKLDIPRKIFDRGIYYTQYYDINGGHRWANSFTASSMRCLGWTSGAHGLRHSYAQERMYELQHQGLNRRLALLTVSQELGHFRPEITEVYLR